MPAGFTYKQLQQRIKELEEEAVKCKETREALRESTRRLELAYDQAIIYAEQLKGEIAERKRAEEALQGAREELELQVARRTAELTKAIAFLKHQIAERKAAEQALRIEKDNLVNILDSMVDGVYIIDEQCRMQYANPPLAKEFGPPQGKKCYEYFHDRKEACPWCKNEEVFAGKTARWEWRASKGGKTYDVIDTLVKNTDGSMSKLQILRDVTERKRMEEEKRRLETELQRTHKMEALGTLAAGIAHQFYEIVGMIIGNTELALYETARERSAQHNLEEVLKACMRAEDVVTQILTFSRQGEQKKQAVLVGLVVQEAVKLLQATLPATIEIRQETEGSSGSVLADPTHIRQVLMNLWTNAAWAMREKGGVLGVRVADVDVDGDAAAQYPELSPGPYVKLTVRDTGPGIAPNVIEQVFDPYFTTKKAGEGTGMGLAVVYGIAESYGGTVAVDSEIGKGATFHVFFPRVESKGAPATQASQDPLMGNERILFVDDEPAVAAVGKQMLETLGYEVVAKSSSTEALETFRAAPDGFDLVITDQIMPHMRGEVLAEELTRIRPDIPIILSTVRGGDIAEEKAKRVGIRGSIVKPMVTRIVAQNIREVLRKK